jgi:hypothetical protein
MSAASSYLGARTLQCPHQGAKNFTIMLSSPCLVALTAAPRDSEVSRTTEPALLANQAAKTSTIRNGLHARPHRLRRPARVPLAPNAYVVSILMVTHDLAVPPPPWSASAG